MAASSTVRCPFRAQASEDSHTASQDSLRGLLCWPVSGRYSEKVGRPVSLSLMMHRALDLLARPLKRLLPCHGLKASPRPLEAPHSAISAGLPFGDSGGRIALSGLEIGLVRV